MLLCTQASWTCGKRDIPNAPRVYTQVTPRSSEVMRDEECLVVEVGGGADGALATPQRRKNGRGANSNGRTS